MTRPARLSVENLVKRFPIRSGILQTVVGQVNAVDHVSFKIESGKTLALVGESGCGKSTVGKAILKLHEPDSGTIQVAGLDITKLNGRAMKPVRRKVQTVFQDPYSSLNPRMTAGRIVGEALTIHGLARGTKWTQLVAEVFEKVGLREEMMHRYPHEFSGGQRQRLSIARAIIVEPDLIIADEPVSALDVSIQASVINLLIRLQKDMDLAMLFISHDMSVVEHISHNVAVMYLGRIVEMAERKALFAKPLHPYTEALVSAVPVPDPSRTGRRRIVLKGDVPSPIKPPSGCHFHTRCPLARPRCETEQPPLKTLNANHQVACHFRPEA